MFNYNSPLLIDIDGPDGDDDGNVGPFLVFCDVKSFPGIPVTVVPHDKGTGPNTPDSPGDNPINYPAPMEGILKLLTISGFCSQKIEYECEVISSNHIWCSCRPV